MTLEYKILLANNSQLSFRGSTWEEIVSGSLEDCESEMKKLSE